MKKNRIAIVLTSHATLGDTGKPTGYYLPEAAHAFEVFARAGYEITFVSPRGGAAPLDPGGQDRADAANAGFLDSPVVQHAVQHTYRPDEINGAALSAIYFAGGHGTMWDFRSPELTALAAAVYQGGGVISAVCHGIAALLDVQVDGRPLVAGQPVTGFSDAEEEAVGLTRVVPFLVERELVARGGRYEKAGALFGAHVAIGRRLVTGQNPASTRGVAEAVVRTLAG